MSDGAVANLPGNPPPVQAVLLDWDDTLVDWLAAIRRAAPPHRVDGLLRVVAERTWQRAGGPPHPHHDEHLRHVPLLAEVAPGTVLMRDTWIFHELPHEVWPHAFPHEDPDVLAAEIAACRAVFAVDPFDDTWHAVDEVRHRLGLPVAVVSNNPYLHAELERLGCADRFDLAIALAGPDDKKPRPHGFLRAAAALGVPPAACCYVGDSVQNDALAAHAAGLVSVWLDRHGDPWDRPHGIHRITSLAELPALLELLGTSPSPQPPTAPPVSPSACSPSGPSA